jgi:hypothetical protein
MLRKLPLITAVAACLFIPSAAFSAKGGGGAGTMHSSGGGGGGGTMRAGGGSNVGGSGRMRVEGGGGGRRFWHGHWYGYGVGPCWSVTPVGYIWICG